MSSLSSFLPPFLFLITICTIVFSNVTLCIAATTSPLSNVPIQFGVLYDKLSPIGMRLISFSNNTSINFSSLIAWGGYHDTISTDGWSYLRIHGSPIFKDSDVAFAAGLLEGYLTANRIFEFATNTDGPHRSNPYIRRFLDSNREFMDDMITKSKISENNLDNVWWNQVYLTLQQQNGMISGYNLNSDAEHYLSDDTLRSLSLLSDTEDICSALGCDDNNKIRGDGHCSLLIRLVQRNNTLPELYFAHNTWASLEQMTRVTKLYDLPYNSKGKVVPGRVINFTSYPGCLYSQDDWYVSSSGIAVSETTITNHNNTLWKHVTPQTVLTWIRTMIATRLGFDGPSWANSFIPFNSGTYNNEFHVVDYNLFKIYQKSSDKERSLANIVTIIDQMPGRTWIWDPIDFLKQRHYWASYNRPSHPEVYNVANYTALQEHYGDHYSWQNAARGQLFKKLAPSVVDEISLRTVMRYNRYFDDDPTIAWQGCLNGPSASNAIAERGDLTFNNSTCISDLQKQDEAAIDLKYTSASLMSYESIDDITVGAFIQVSGPPFNEEIKPFQWSACALKPVPSHVGQPDIFNFDYVQVRWKK